MKNFFLKLPILFFAVSLFYQSCANTATPPIGGPKDTIPPVLAGVVPSNNSVNFPLEKGRIELEFNEYVSVKDAQKGIVISPPLMRKSDIKTKGKSVVVKFNTTLDSAISYTIDFGNSIVDNNEGNIFPQYSYSFSTSSTLDSLYISGAVYDFKTLLPVEKINIALYKSEISDSAIVLTNPLKYAKSDKWGYFVLKNLKSKPYRVIAFNDLNDNYRYDQESEKIAFIDSLITPVKIIKDSLNELIYIDPKDTVNSISRTKDLSLYLFKDPYSKQFILDSKREDKRKIYVKFTSPKVNIFSIQLEKIDSTTLIKQFNSSRDSLVLWSTAIDSILIDTLKLYVGYYKSDTTDRLIPVTDTLDVIAPFKKQEKKEKESQIDNFGKEIKQQRENKLDFILEAKPETVEQSGFVLQFPAPIKMIDSLLISLSSISPKGQIAIEYFKLSIDTTNLTRYYIKSSNKIRPGYEYRLRIPEKAITDIYDRYNDTIVKSVMLPKDEALAKISLDIKGVNGSFIVELINPTRDRTFRSYSIQEDTILDFPYLTPGKYSFRFTEDLNSNGIIDEGSFIDKRQPEKVRVLYLSNGASFIEIGESMELTQKVELMEVFK